MIGCTAYETGRYLPGQVLLLACLDISITDKFFSSFLLQYFVKIFKLTKQSCYCSCCKQPREHRTVEAGGLNSLFITESGINFEFVMR